MVNDPHGPNRFSTYWQVHKNRMAQFEASGFVGDDTVDAVPQPGGFIRIAGEIGCLGQIVIAVEKRLTVVDYAGDDPIVQTLRYGYNASVRGHNTFFRHDSEDHHGFADGHHRHICDWRTGQGRVEWVSDVKWPTLGQFIETVEEWYWQRRDELPVPDEYPPDLAVYLRRHKPVRP